MASKPDGMYTLNTDDAEHYKTFAEFREVAESASNILNLPLSWVFDDEKEEWDDDDWIPTFTLAFLAPRKNRSWGMVCEQFNRDEVQAWLDTWLRGQIDHWFGWDTTST